MEIAFNLVLHALLIGSMTLFMIELVKIAIRPKDPGERMRRVLALFVGALVVLGAQAAGLDYAGFAGQALAGSRIASQPANLGTTIVPGMLGAAMGFFFVAVQRKSEDLGMRVICFIGMLALTVFTASYAAALQVNGLFIGGSVVPNIAFVAGVILVIVFDTRGAKSKRSSATSAASRLSQNPDTTPADGPLGRIADSALRSARDRFGK